MPGLEGWRLPKKRFVGIPEVIGNEGLGVRMVKEPQRERLGRNEAPSCPKCNALMDLEGYSFASKLVIEGVFYYCNNPACNRGGCRELEHNDADQPESGGRLNEAR